MNFLVLSSRDSTQYRYYYLYCLLSLIKLKQNNIQGISNKLWIKFVWPKPHIHVFYLSLDSDTQDVVDDDHRGDRHCWSQPYNEHLTDLPRPRLHQPN